MGKAIQIAAVVFAAAAAATGYAETLTFDGLESRGSAVGPITNGYGGLDWYNMWAIDGPSTYGPSSGYSKGLVSGNIDVYNGCGLQSEISEPGSSFTLHSGYFTSAYGNGNELTVQGYEGGLLLYTQTAVLNTASPQLLTFEFQNVDSVTFSSSNGQFVLDDLSVFVPRSGVEGTTTPAPAAAIVFCLGALSRRRRR